MDRGTTAAELVAAVRGDTRDLHNDMREAEGIVKRTADNMAKEGSRAGQGFGSELGSGVLGMLPSGLKMLAGGAAVAGVSALAKQVGRVTMEMGHLGAEVKGVQRGFEVFVPDAENGLERMRAATRGTMSDLALMESASTAHIMGVVKNVDELVMAKEVATARAGAMGKSVEAYFQSMITALGTGNQQAMRNLGIMMDAAAVYDEYAKSVGKSADALTEQEKASARLAAVINDEGTQSLIKMQKEVGGTLDAYDRLSASKTNFRTELGLSTNAILENTGALEAQARMYSNMTAMLAEGRERAASYKEAQDAVTASVFLSAEQAKEYDQAIGAVSLQERRGIVDREQAAQAYRALIDEIQATNDAQRAATAAFDESEAVLYAYMAGLDGAAASADGLSSSLGRLGALIMANKGALEFAAEDFGIGIVPTGAQVARSQGARDAAVARQRYERGSMNDPQHLQALRGDLGRLREGSAEYYDKLSEIHALEQRMARARTTGTRAINDQTSAIRSLARAQLGLTQVSREDALRTALGTYEDKPDEYIRRLRSAVQDAESEWKHLLGGRSGDEAELFLMQQERAFTTGAWHEMAEGFDRTEAIQRMVDNVRRELEAQAHMESLLDEVMGHFGGGVSRKQVAGMMGMPEDHALAGRDAAMGIAQGMESAGVAEKYAETFEREFAEQQERWISMGSLSVKWMAQGVEKGTTPEVVGILLNVLLPKLQGALLGGHRP